MKRLVLAALAMLPATFAGATTPQDYAYAWPLTTVGDSGAWQIELTPDIYAATVDGELRDIEVFNADNQPVPMAPVTLDRQVVRRDEDLVLPLFALPRSENANGDDVSLHLERDADGRLRRLDANVAAPPPNTAVDYLLDASAAGDPIDALVLDWDAGPGVQASFRVESSDDLQTWRSLSTATVLDLRRDDARLAHHRIAVAETRAHYFRLRRLDSGAALTSPAASARLRKASTVETPARHWLDVPLKSDDTRHASRTEAGKDVVAYVYALPAALPVEAARIELGSDNSIARLSVLSRPRQAAAGGPEWLPRAELTAFRLRQDGDVLSNDEVAIESRERATEWRIETWQPLDRPPALALAYRPDRFVFLARGNGPFRLLAGSRTARRASYPVDTALASLRNRFGPNWQPPLATPAARVDAGGDIALAAAVPPRPWKTWLLWTVLIGGAALVALMVMQLLREGPRKSGE